MLSTLRFASLPIPFVLSDNLLTRGTMTSTLGRLHRAGLIEMHPDASDGRGKLVRLTEAGRAMRQRCVATIMPLVPVLDGLLEPDEVRQIMPLLSRLLGKLDQIAR